MQENAELPLKLLQGGGKLGISPNINLLRLSKHSGKRLEWLIAGEGPSDRLSGHHHDRQATIPGAPTDATLSTAEARIRYAMESSGLEYVPPKKTESAEQLMQRPFVIARLTGYEADWLATGEGPITHEEATKDLIDISPMSDDAKVAMRANEHAFKNEGDRSAKEA